MVSYDEEIACAPQYVAEPAFIHNAQAQSTLQSPPIPKNARGKFKPYCPGAMLSESAFVTPGYGQQYGSAAFMNEMLGVSAQVSAGEAHDPEAESDCSTTDTMNDAMSMQMAGSDGSALGSAAAFMMADMGMLAESPWPSYAAPEYWMPYPAVPPQSQQTWSQMPSAGSNGHRLGKCKPCAFMYKDGCRSGNACPYCHLCPPGEKQRRKRVMRAMQRNMGTQ